MIGFHVSPILAGAPALLVPQHDLRQLGIGEVVYVAKGTRRPGVSSCQVLTPWLQAGAQALQVQVWERFFCAAQVAWRALQHGAGAGTIARGLVMKGYRELNQALEMASPMAVAGSSAPNIFQRLMSLKEAGGIEKRQAASEVVLVHGSQSGLVS